MAEPDRSKTAFVTTFAVMSFGICNAPATFERVIDYILHGLKLKTRLCYLDDIVIFSHDFVAHLQRLKTFLTCISSAGLQLGLKKYCFGARNLLVLVHVVSRDGGLPDPTKLRAVAELPQPTTMKDLRSFLGPFLFSTFHRQLRLNNSAFVWPSSHQHDLSALSPVCDDALTKLRHIRMSPSILRRFDLLAPTEMRTDASSVGLGAVLAQQKRGFGEYVVAYTCHALTKAYRSIYSLLLARHVPYEHQLSFGP